MHSSMIVESLRKHHKLMDDRGIVLAWLMDNQIYYLQTARYMDNIERGYNEIFGGQCPPVAFIGHYRDASNNWFKRTYLNGIIVRNSRMDVEDNTISWSVKIYDRRKKVLEIITQQLPMPIYEEIIGHIL